MEEKFRKYLYDSFSKLVEKYGFTILTELNEKGVYSIEYGSDTFVINLEKYHREFYVSLYKTGNPNDGVNLYNLLNYLNKGSSVATRSRYGEEEEDLGENYQEQFNYIVDTIDENFAQIDAFFKSANLQLEMAQIRKFIVNKYPNLFKGL